jgi:hypothetical protein
MVQRRCEFVDSRLRRCPPDRASAVPYGQAGENALRFPHVAHRSAAAHKLHSATATTRIEFDSGSGETFSRLPALAYSARNLSKRPAPPQMCVVAYQLTLIHGRIEQRGDLGFGQLLSSHHSCLPGVLRSADQPIQDRESIRVLRLRPKVRQTAALPAPAVSGASGQPRNHDRFRPSQGRARCRLSSWFVRLCVKSRRFVSSGPMAAARQSCPPVILIGAMPECPKKVAPAPLRKPLFSTS